MNKQLAYNRPKEANMRKLYIITKPDRLTDFSIDDITDEHFKDEAWRDKARKLQIRRWRKIKHQLV